MSTVESILASVIEGLPDAIGVVVCDADGESIAVARGAAPMPAGAIARARAGVPSEHARPIDLEVMALRRVAGELGVIVRGLESAARAGRAGALAGYEVRHSGLHALVAALVDDTYAVLLVRPSPQRARARARLDRAVPPLSALLG